MGRFCRLGFVVVHRVRYVRWLAATLAFGSLAAESGNLWVFILNLIEQGAHLYTLIKEHAPLTQGCWIKPPKIIRLGLTNDK